MNIQNLSPDSGITMNKNLFFFFIVSYVQAYTHTHVFHKSESRVYYGLMTFDYYYYSPYLYVLHTNKWMEPTCVIVVEYISFDPYIFFLTMWTMMMMMMINTNVIHSWYNKSLLFFLLLTTSIVYNFLLLFRKKKFSVIRFDKL